MKFKDNLNEKIWNLENNDMLPEVKEKLFEIANAFIEYIEVPQDAVLDMVVTGSSASYNYNKYSDLDLHIIVDYDKIHEDCPLVEGYLGALKNTFNKEHDIFIHGVPVELYAEKKDQGTVHNGLYSLNTGWIDFPKKIEPTDNDAAVEAKYKEIKEMIDKCDDSEAADELLEKIYNMRKAGLAEAGEFGTENLAFKKLRNEGCMDKLRKLKKEKIDKQLSLESYNETLEQDVKELTKTDDYYKVDGSRVSIKNGFGSQVELMDLQNLGKKLEKKGYKVYCSNYYIDAKKNESVNETLTSRQTLTIQGIWNAYEHGLVTKERTLQRYEEYLSENNMAEGDLIWAIGKDKWDHLHNIMTGNPELDDDLNESVNEADKSGWEKWKSEPHWVKKTSKGSAVIHQRSDGSYVAWACDKSGRQFTKDEIFKTKKAAMKWGEDMIAGLSEDEKREYYAVYAYESKAQQYHYPFNTKEEAEEKFNEIKKYGITGWFGSDTKVREVELVKEIEDSHGNVTITQRYDSFNESIKELSLESYNEELYIGNEKYIIIPVSYVDKDIRILDKKTGEFIKDASGENLKFATEEECKDYIENRLTKNESTRESGAEKKTVILEARYEKILLCTSDSDSYYKVFLLKGNNDFKIALQNLWSGNLRYLKPCTSAEEAINLLVKGMKRNFNISTEFKFSDNEFSKYLETRIMELQDIKSFDEEWGLISIGDSSMGGDYWQLNKTDKGFSVFRYVDEHKEYYSRNQKSAEEAMDKAIAKCGRLDERYDMLSNIVENKLISKFYNNEYSKYFYTKAIELYNKMYPEYQIKNESIKESLNEESTIIHGKDLQKGHRYTISREMSTIGCDVEDFTNKEIEKIKPFVKFINKNIFDITHDTILVYRGKFRDPYNKPGNRSIKLEIEGTGVILELSEKDTFETVEKEDLSTSYTKYCIIVAEDGHWLKNHPIFDDSEKANDYIHQAIKDGRRGAENWQYSHLSKQDIIDLGLQRRISKIKNESINKDNNLTESLNKTINEAVDEKTIYSPRLISQAYEKEHDWYKSENSLDDNGDLKDLLPQVMLFIIEDNNIIDTKLIDRKDVYTYKPNDNEYYLDRIRDTGYVLTDYNLEPAQKLVDRWNESKKWENIEDSLCQIDLPIKDEFIEYVDLYPIKYAPELIDIQFIAKDQEGNSMPIYVANGVIDSTDGEWNTFPQVKWNVTHLNDKEKAYYIQNEFTKFINERDYKLEELKKVIVEKLKELNLTEINESQEEIATMFKITNFLKNRGYKVNNVTKEGLKKTLSYSQTNPIKDSKQKLVTGKSLEEILNKLKDMYGSMNEKVEETKNYKRTRLCDPKTCKKDSFRTKQVNNKGDKIILCQDKETGKMKAQSKLIKKQNLKEYEELQYGVEYRNMYDGIHRLFVTDTKEKAELILTYLKELETPDTTVYDDNEIMDNAIFTWEEINKLANDCFDVDYRETENCEGVYDGIYIINYNDIKPDIYESLNESLNKLIETALKDSEIKILVKNVRWDADEEEDIKDLPTEFYLEVEDTDEETISDAITDEFGFTHKGFDYEIV